MGGEGEDAGVFKVAGFTFFANFDSGNLGHVRQDADEEIDDEDEEGDNEDKDGDLVRPSTSGGGQARSVGSEAPDFRFSLWTRPDCQGTEFENGNRTWFYFGMRGGAPGAVVQFTLQNLNKQNKLFSQGMAPVFQVVIRTFFLSRIILLTRFRCKESQAGRGLGTLPISGLRMAPST